ncbi:MAG: cupin domain-containing protein, partial [Pseudomonadota bacterium]
MIRHHPLPSMLQEYVAGTLDPATSLMVSAHCDMCPTCDKYARSLAERGGNKLEAEDADEGLDREFATMMDDIVANDIEVPHSVRRRVKQEPKSMMEFDGKSFSVPRALRKFVEKDLTWSRYLGRMSHANVSIGGGNLAQFIFMEAGAGVPEHTHKGNEITLVLDGEFCDGLSVYKNGDLTFMN